MLQGINRIGRSWVGKVIVTILFSFLIISFAVWGIGDIFRGAVRNNVASVGGTDITAEAYRNAFQAEVQQLSRRSRQSISTEQARQLGIDTRVLGRLMTEAALDQRARDLGLGISSELVVQSIMRDENFRGANGQFDRARFDEVLFSNSLNENTYAREQRAVIARMQLAEAVTGALPVPVAMREAIHRYGSERRSAGYVTLTAASVGEIPAPSDEQLKSFFEERKGSFRAPDYRSGHALVLTPETLVQPDAVSDAEARQRYEQLKAGRFGTAEKRTVQQVVFPTIDEARAASERIKAGTTFEALASERNIDAGSLELGTLAKAEMIDATVADAAFALAEGAVSEPVAGRFGNVLVRVTRIEPERVRPYEEVAAEVKSEIALERARNQIADVHDAIEDLRASARPLSDIAKEKNLALTMVPLVDRSGNDKGGQPVATLPERDALLTALFNSDIGVDNEPLRTRNGGYVWYDVAGIEPGRDRTLDEVRGAVEAQWRGDQIATRLADRGRALVERLEKGEAIDAIGAELGAPAKTVTDLARATPKDELAADVVNRMFAVPVGKAASASSGDEASIVFKVTGATLPPFVTSTQEAERIQEQLRRFLADDLLTQYIAQLQKEYGTEVNQANLRRATGGDS